MQPTVNVVLGGLVLFFFVLPLLRGALQARAERDPWAPFSTRPDGRDGILAPGPYFQALRAPRGAGRTTTGLVVRWAGWVAVTLSQVVGVVWRVLSPGGGSP